MTLLAVGRPLQAQEVIQSSLRTNRELVANNKESLLYQHSLVWSLTVAGEIEHALKNDGQSRKLLKDAIGMAAPFQDVRFQPTALLFTDCSLTKTNRHFFKSRPQRNKPQRPTMDGSILFDETTGFRLPSRGCPVFGSQKEDLSLPTSRTESEAGSIRRSRRNVCPTPSLLAGMNHKVHFVGS